MVDAVSTPPTSPSPMSQRARTCDENPSSKDIVSNSQRRTLPSPSKARLASSPTANLIYDIFHFESSDDDVPLQPPFRNQGIAFSSPPTVVENLAAATTSESPEKSQSLPRRALRARKPEQQMPYTLDLIRHRDQFRRRGLKPVHNPDAQSRVREDDDQYQADEEEVEVDKDEQYFPPKDIREPAPKRRRIDENEGSPDDDMDIQLLVGRRKFLDPRQFDVRKQKPVQQVTPDREVNQLKRSLILRYLITISVRMMDWVHFQHSRPLFRL